MEKTSHLLFVLLICGVISLFSVQGLAIETTDEDTDQDDQSSSSDDTDDDLSDADSEEVAGWKQVCHTNYRYGQCSYGSLKLGKSTSTMCAKGCALCASASALRALDVKIPGTGDAIDPRSLNAYFKYHNGFSSQPDKLDWLSWVKVGSMGVEYVRMLENKDGDTWVHNKDPVYVDIRYQGFASNEEITRTQAFNLLKKDLDNCAKPICKVAYFKNNKLRYHWVLFDKVTEKTYSNAGDETIIKDAKFAAIDSGGSTVDGYRDWSLLDTSKCWVLCKNCADFASRGTKGGLHHLNKLKRLYRTTLDRDDIMYGDLRGVGV